MCLSRIAKAIYSVLLVFFFTSSSAYAAGGFFGVQERIKCLQSIEVNAPAPLGEPPYIRHINLDQPKYSLCYKYTILYFFAGVYLHNDGYVLAERDDDYRYVPLDSSKISELQAKGILPNELPPYSIPWSQYAVGYSLWLFFVAFFAGTFLWRGFKRWKNKGKYCLQCDLILTEQDFKTGRCGSCGEPVPPTTRTSDSIAGA